MNICVVGWYFYDNIYNVLQVVSKKYPVFIVSHKKDDKIKSFGLPYKEVPNIGLEFGAYDYYLKNEWDKKSGVLFIHDDLRIEDDSVFDRIAEIETKDIDQAYFFRDLQEQTQNGGKHGRAIYISKKLLSFMLSFECTCYQCVDHYDAHNPETILQAAAPHTGFWYDINNTGHSSGKPPKGVRHYNEMIYHFHRYLGWIRDGRLGNEKMNVLYRIHVPELDCGRRGKFLQTRAK